MKYKINKQLIFGERKCMKMRLALGIHKDFSGTLLEKSWNSMHVCARLARDILIRT